MHTLICPLDWGLGHASRSLALAERLRGRGDRISWAGSGPAAAMLRRELPQGERVYPLPPYSVRYPSRSMVLNVALQSPRWARTVYRERRALARLIEEIAPDRIISDSRFGCYNPGVESIFLSHQLSPITGSRIVDYLYRRQLTHFDAFWVPDEPGGDRLSGCLSEPAGLGPTLYIGMLSRLPTVPPAPAERKILFLLSGPEPARSALEAELLTQLSGLPGRHTLVRGLPESGEMTPPGVARSGTAEPPEIIQYADGQRLAALLGAHELVVCRSGYSTLMDLRRAGQRAILLPTPGQTEQHYLADRAERQGWAVNGGSGRFDLIELVQRLG